MLRFCQDDQHPGVTGQLRLNTGGLTRGFPGPGILATRPKASPLRLCRTGVRVPRGRWRLAPMGGILSIRGWNVAACLPVIDERYEGLMRGSKNEPKRYQFNMSHS